MQRELCAYLRDMQQSVHDIRTFTQPFTVEQFEQNRPYVLAVERSYEIIGEALRQANRLYPGVLQRIPAIREVIDQRNDIAHRYFDVDAALLWSAAQSELTPFLAIVEELITLHCPSATPIG